MVADNVYPRTAAQLLGHATIAATLHSDQFSERCQLLTEFRLVSILQQA